MTSSITFRIAFFRLRWLKASIVNASTFFMKFPISWNSSMGIFWEKKNKEDGKKSRFLHEIPNEGGRFSIEFVRYFLNTVQFSQNSIQIYGQSAVFGWFVRKQNAFYGQTGIFQRFVRKFLAIMMMIYGHKPLFGAFVRKIGSETSEFLRTNGCFWPFCP